MQYAKKFKYTDPQLWEKCLYFSQQFAYCCALNNNKLKAKYGSFPNLIAWANKPLPLNPTPVFEQLAKLPEAYYFGFLGYDLKNEVYSNLKSQKPNRNNFPLYNLFRAEVIIEFQCEDEVLIKSERTDPEEIYSQLCSYSLPARHATTQIVFTPVISKPAYLTKVEAIRQHILAGDCYELNLCHEFIADKVKLEPVHTYLKLCEHSPAPFSAFYKANEHFLISASPERFIKKIANTVISQPIKGTAARGKTPTEDQQQIHNLQHSEKEIAENMMIVDLVRNDLARNAKAGSVKVPELFKIYTFPQVHQMISTVTAELKEEKSGIEALKWAFPMGSMTGAPKVKVMELIEQYEESMRAAYSGCLGYIDANGDYDFNVLIRTLFYNREEQRLSFQVGGAITWDSDPELEYKECLTKASGLLKTLNADIL